MTDCDPFRHLKNSKYLDYIMNVRVQQVKEHYNLDFIKHAENDNSSWVVMSNHIKYMRPAIMGEEVVVTTRLIDFTDDVLHLEAVMTDYNQEVIKCILWSKFKYVDFLTGIPKKHIDEHMNLFERILVQSEKDDFDSRCRELYNEIKLARV